MTAQSAPTVQSIRDASPFPWIQQFNFDGRGGLRLVDAAGREVPLFSITNLACIVATQMAAQQAKTAEGQSK